jgi:peptide/nickel transport system substrate-binding protein
MSVIALVVVAILTAALVSAASAGPQGKSAKGGTYRVGWESSFGFTDNFDPTGEYLANSFAINTNLLLRGLVGYNHEEGAKGAVVVPDLATTVPKPTNGGKRYTFKLKK